MKVLVTCPPMLGMKDQFLPIFETKQIEVHTPEVIQVLPEDELIKLAPEFDGWIIGDDPATRAVFKAGQKGNLKAAVKWGVGVDNVDFAACREFGISISNTPDMFGAEVADIAVNYVTALARETYFIDRQVRKGFWPKPRGVSLSGKTVGLVGYGDIGQSTAKRLIAADMTILAYDPIFDERYNTEEIKFLKWPDRIGECDFLVFTCSLNLKNHNMLNAQILAACTKGVRIVNVARGALIDERALIASLQSQQVHSAALDVFEVEPLPRNSLLKKMEQCILGSHNASNTAEAVAATNNQAIKKLFEFLGVN